MLNSISVINFRRGAVSLRLRGDCVPTLQPDPVSTGVGNRTICFCNCKFNGHRFQRSTQDGWSFLIRRSLTEDAMKLAKELKF